MLTSNKTGKIGYVLEDQIKRLLGNNYKIVSENEVTQRFYTTYPFLDQSNSFRDNLEYWYIYDGITLCKHNHFPELEFRNKALEAVKNRSDYKDLSIFQILDFLYLIDYLIWVENRMVGIQIASIIPKGLSHTNFNGNNEFSKYSSVRSLAKRGIHSWLDTMIVIYSGLDYLKSDTNIKGLIQSIREIAIHKPLTRHYHGYENPGSVYEGNLKKGLKPFLITVNENGVKYTNTKTSLDNSLTSDSYKSPFNILN